MCLKKLSFLAISIVCIVLAVMLGSSQITNEYSLKTIDSLMAIEQGKKDIASSLLLCYPQKEQKFWLKNCNYEIIKTGLHKYEAETYANIFYKLSKDYNIEWEIYAAVLYIESQFNTGLTSPSNAKGIAQIVESTLEQQCKKQGIIYKKDVTCWNDIININVGLNYLSGHIKDKGSIELGCKRYYGHPSKDELNRYWNAVNEEFLKIKYIYQGVKNGK